MDNDSHNGHIHTGDHDASTANSKDSGASNGSTVPVTTPPAAPQRPYPVYEPGDPDALAEELDRQARETLRIFRETVGDLGARVRQVVAEASTRWEDAHPTTQDVHLAPAEVEHQARTLARRWVERDFLVDPELPDAMGVVAVQSASLWRVELRERGEARTLAESTEPYTGQRPSAPGPVLPVWDYEYPAVPDIEAGERRERIGGSAMLAACLTCNGTGHRFCATCDGKGFVQCPICHGRARTQCRRCRGRGVIADATAERRARSGMGYLQVQAERLAADAGERLADVAERLRQDYGVPLPPSDTWVPTAPASGQTLPCPECTNGTIACACGNGKRVCETCHGTSAALCVVCSGSGKVVRHRDLVRHFDTRISERVLPLDDADLAQHLTSEMVRKGSGEQVWDGALHDLDTHAPSGVPAVVWEAAHTLARARDAASAQPNATVSRADEHAMQNGRLSDGEAGERRILSRRVQVSRIPVSRVEYTFAGHPYAFVAVGRAGTERFWARAFPPRWSRVGRFLKALSRDVQGEGRIERVERPEPRLREPGSVSSIEEFRQRRNPGASDENGN